MAYASISDVFIRFPPINTIVGTGENQVTSVQISSQYLADAEGFVNGYIGARYAVPVTMPEPLITMVTCDMALWKLCEDKLPRMPEYMEMRYKNAISVLENLRDGKMVLSSSQTILGSGDQEAWTNTQSYHSIFSPVLTDIDQRVDADFVYDERVARRDDV